MSRTTTKGFTLVEMLVIAPIVILAIGAFLAVIISMTGEVIASRASNTMMYDLQDTLNRIEQDVKQSNGFLATNSIPVTASSAQGFNNDATSFTNNSAGATGTGLILNMVATNKSPEATDRSYIYLRNQPNDCSDPYNNTPMTYNIVYFVKDNSLWRRTLMPTNYNDTTAYSCSVPWQIPSCAPSYMTSAPANAFCKTNDIELAQNITPSDFTVAYYPAGVTDTPNTEAATNSNPSIRADELAKVAAVKVDLTAKRTVSGRDITHSNSIRAQRLDPNATIIAALSTAGTTQPTSPIVSGNALPGARATFTWGSVSGATGYTLEYSVNGGAWQAGFTNQPTRTYTVNAPASQDKIAVRVAAINAVGTSDYGNSSLTLPLWEPLILKNNWIPYRDTYSTPAYTKTRSGMVMFKGLIKKPSGAATDIIATLPENFRPEGGRLVFGSATNSDATGRVDVMTNGDVVPINASAPWLSLENIRFVPGGRYTRTPATLANGWTNYGMDYAPASYVQADNNRVVIQGLLTPGTIANGAQLFDLPAAQRPSNYMHIATRSNGWGYVGVEYRTSAQTGVVAKNVGNAYLSVNLTYLNNAYTDWVSMPLVNGWNWYSDSNGMYSPPSYTKTSDGVVTLRGLVRSSSGVIFTLPPGYRPKERTLLQTVSIDQFARVDIMPTGEVTMMTGSNVWFSLDGISFISER